MLKNVSGLNIFMVNFWIVVLWHVAFFLACIKLPESRFDFQRSRFMPRDWEKGGRWYRDKLRIQEWKDKVPQFVKMCIRDRHSSARIRFIVTPCITSRADISACPDSVHFILFSFLK